MAWKIRLLSVCSFFCESLFVHWTLLFRLLLCPKISRVKSLLNLLFPVACLLLDGVDTGYAGLTWCCCFPDYERTFASNGSIVCSIILDLFV